MATPEGSCWTPIVVGVWAVVETGKTSTTLAPFAVPTVVRAWERMFDDVLAA